MPFIVGGFAKTGKSISESFAGKICDFVDCHSWYVQQLSYFVWADTESVVSEEILENACTRIVDTNAPMFTSDLEKLTSSQKAMLKAIARGETQLSSEAVRGKYALGNLTTITRNKKVLQTKSFVDINDNLLTISDPVFFKWFTKKYDI